MSQHHTDVSEHGAGLTRRGRIASIGSTSAWVLALLLCFLPFLSVSCDAPGGFGRMEAGGTTTWSGFDLAVGSTPSVDENKLRPVAEQQSDDLGWQPVVAVGFLAIAAGIMLAARKRWSAAVIAGFSAIGLLVIGELLARSEIVDMVALQVTEPFADGKTAGDHVAFGIGYWLVLLLALIGTACALVGLRSAGRTPSSGGVRDDSSHVR